MFFITYFLGDDSGRVVIWNMAPIVKEQAEEDVNIPKLMCQMDNHLGINLLVTKYFKRFINQLGFLLSCSLCELCKVVKFWTVFGFWRR